MFASTLLHTMVLGSIAMAILALLGLPLIVLAFGVWLESLSSAAYRGLLALERSRVPAASSRACRFASTTAWPPFRAKSVGRTISFIA